jgi:hypothetical protein
LVPGRYRADFIARECPDVRCAGLKTKPIANRTANPEAEDDSDVSALINQLTAEVNQIAVDKTKSIQQITNEDARAQRAEQPGRKSYGFACPTKILEKRPHAKEQGLPA